jgi:hypothetical protein
LCPWARELDTVFVHMSTNKVYGDGPNRLPLAELEKYVDQARRGDHICYYSDLRKIREHYPAWQVSRSLANIVEELADGWRRLLPA